MIREINQFLRDFHRLPKEIEKLEKKLESIDPQREAQQLEKLKLQIERHGQKLFEKEAISDRMDDDSQRCRELRGQVEYHRRLIEDKKELIARLSSRNRSEEVREKLNTAKLRLRRTIELLYKFGQISAPEKKQRVLELLGESWLNDYES